MPPCENQDEGIKSEAPVAASFLVKLGKTDLSEKWLKPLGFFVFFSKSAMEENNGKLLKAAGCV